MASTYQLLLNGSAADDTFLSEMVSLVVEENADLPGAIQIILPVDRSVPGDLTYAGDENLQPFASVSVVATPDGGADSCLFDGYVLSQKLHLENAITNSTLQVWGTGRLLSDEPGRKNAGVGGHHRRRLGGGDLPRIRYLPSSRTTAPRIGRAQRTGPDADAARHRHPIPAVIGTADRQTLPRDL